jgi:uncharacterized protein YacL
MLFETLSQPKIFAFLAMAGFLTGFVFDVSNYILWLCKKNKIVQIATDFLATMISFVIFYLVVLKLNYGSVRLYQIFAFVITFIIQRITLGKIIANFFDWCYNLFTKILQKLLKGLQKKKHEKHNNQPTNKTI